MIPDHLPGRLSRVWYKARYMPGILLTWLLYLYSLPAYAGDNDQCFEEAARYQQVNPMLLKAIAWVESRGTPDARNYNRNGSVDYGIMQINSVHLKELSKFGISRQMLQNACTNIFVAAWHLRRQINQYGYTWKAVGAYHSATPSLRDAYASKVKQLLTQANVPVKITYD